MNKKVTLSIGIPAYNEGSNIRVLLRSILAQNKINFFLDKIIVFSDGSTDDTVKEAASLRNTKIEIISINKRKGKSNALNKIGTRCKSDVLLHLDADILIKDKRLIEKLIEPIITKNADLTSARVKEYSSVGKFEKVLRISMQLKKEIFEKLNDGNNIYTCHGRARAMTRKLYKSIHFSPGVVAEDAYAYLYVVSKGFKYVFAKEANVHYHLPQNLADHMKQSLRFVKSYQQLKKEFGIELISRETRIPKRIAIPVLIKYFFRYPLTLTVYLLVLVTIRLKSMFRFEQRANWEISKSSKGAFIHS